jgi:hypothetical protein
VRIAGSTDLQKVLLQLASIRPVFHSEADFQLALAWQLQEHDSHMRVRLETRPEAGAHLDIACSRDDLGLSTAIEVKYLTRRWSGEVNHEQFDLKNQGAQDIRGYDVVKDIYRLERFIDGHRGSDGVAIVLSNDPYYWKPHSEVKKATNAAAFRLGEGIVLNGRRAWGPKTGAGTTKNREDALDLMGSYTLHWQDFATVGIEPNATSLRVLIVPVTHWD